MDKILLIDGLNYIKRGDIKFGFKPEEGKPSYTVVYNFFRNLRATIEEFSPTKIFLCLEGNNVFRYKLYPEYKANRIIKTGQAKEKREDFFRQVNIIVELLAHLPITITKADSYECDDVIATLVEDLKDEQVLIMSTDSDFIQLLQKGYKNLTIYNPRTKEFVASPDYHFLTFKCCGDKTDNIPQLIGKKAAIGLASDPKALATFLSTEENRANFNLNKSLVELKIIPSNELQFSTYSVDYAYLKEQFIKMDFKTIVEDKYWERFCNTFNNLVAK